MGTMNDVFVRGKAFDGATGLKTGAELEDLAARAYPTAASELVDQETLETYSDATVLDDDGNPINRIRIKDGSITNDKLAAGFTMVNSVQRSTAAVSVPYSTTVNVTITSVDVTKAVLLTNISGDGIVKARLSSATNIELVNASGSHYGYVDWQVLEFI